MREGTLEELPKPKPIGGGTIGTSVNKKTSYLVAKDPQGNSSKLKKAADIIGQDRIISIVEARKLWG